jgi:ABC-type sugar transport system substrate-binding protein
MKTARWFGFAAATVLTVVVVGPALAQSESPAASAGAKDPGAAAGKTLFVNMKGPGGGNPFWAAVEQGALDMGAAYGVTVKVLAPPTESDVQAQIAQMEDAVVQGAAGIAVAPTDPAALAPSIDEAIAAGIPVVFIDTKGSNEGVTFIGTNNEVGAALAGKYLCDNVPAGGKVAIIQGVITTSTGKARADGAHAAVTACGLNLVAEVPANFDKAKGQAAMEDILTKNPDLAGVFASNDNMALGAVEALRQQDLVGKVVVVGFDANPDAAAAILAGEMNATIAQSPKNIGGYGVESLIKLINGETLDPIIDTGTELVTKDNAANYTGS